jgi:hypothetical protein
MSIMVRTSDRALLLFMIASAVIAAACSGTTDAARPTTGLSPSAVSTPISPPGATPVPGGCGSTQLYRGGFPSWLAPTARDLTGMGDVPYALSSPSTAAGFAVSYPLKARVSDAKILWVVASPRQDAPLELEVHPRGSSAPVIRESLPANASPGEIYPDGVTIPSSGCWHFQLKWATGKAELDLLYG